MAKRKELYIPHGNIQKMIDNEGYARTSIKNAQKYIYDTPLQREIREVAKKKYEAIDIWVPLNA